MPLSDLSSNIDLVKEIIKRDRKIFLKDFSDSISKNSINDLENSSLSIKKLDDNEKHLKDYLSNIKIFDIEDRFDESLSEKILISDFTEYNPLHNGHFHCMKVAKSKFPDGIFVAIVPGLFERSGRGIPYMLTRQARAEIAINVGADIVVEGPPMGIMGSGQYSICLAKMIKALNTDFIPRGYKPLENFDKVLERIAIGHAVAPKPYKIVDMNTKEVLLEGPLEEDNYVISSLSKSLKKIKFDFKNKFIFVKRIEGVSGTLIRKATSSGNFDNVLNMLPKESIAIIKKEIKEGRAPLHDYRDDETILNSANTMPLNELKSLNIMDNETANKIVDMRDKNNFTKIFDLQQCISYGFSSHFNHRVLSVLEAKINKDIVSKYIDNYPFNIRVLDYKNEHVLEEFMNKINNNYRRIELWQ
ncbi:MAG: nucleotidyltransferase family protein [Methanobacteriaceae archaeon]|jgi:predicted nucleotidyltransferase|nr:nucleotidyltransferase family protein [Candidatus Methanorudis spinitermitis]